MAAGLAIGILLSVLVAFATGCFGITPVAWPVMGLALFGFSRSAGFQAALMAPLCIVCAILGAVPSMPLFFASAVALTGANMIARTESDSCWNAEHGAFAAAALMLYVGSYAMLSGVEAALWQGVWSAVLIALFFLAVFVAHVIAAVYGGITERGESTPTVILPSSASYR